MIFLYIYNGSGIPLMPILKLFIDSYVSFPELLYPFELRI